MVAHLGHISAKYVLFVFPSKKKIFGFVFKSKNLSVIVLLVEKSKIFSFAWENQKKYFFHLRKQSYRFLFAWENKTIFYFDWENKKRFLLTETKLKIFICL